MLQGWKKIRTDYRWKTSEFSPAVQIKTKKKVPIPLGVWCFKPRAVCQNPQAEKARLAKEKSQPCMQRAPVVVVDLDQPTFPPDEL
jgi:hypothetical protein